MIDSSIKTLYVLDGYYHIFRAFFAPTGMEMASPSGEPTSATYMFTVSLLKLIREREPDAIVVAMEGGRTFRSDIDENYKHNRTAPPEEFIIQRDRIEQILAAMNIPVLRCAGFEADDIIGTIAKRAHNAPYEVLICSKDKDMFQLLDGFTGMFDASGGKYTYAEDIQKKLGVTPEQFIDYLALQGDAGDDVPGLPGVGPVRAKKWINQYGSVEGLIEHANEVKGTYGHKGVSLPWTEHIRSNKELILRAKKLVTIDCNVPIEFDFNDFLLRKFDSDKLKEIFVELGFKSLMYDLELDY